MKYRITQVKPFINQRELAEIKNPIKNNFITEGEMRWNDGRHYFGKFKKSKYLQMGSNR